MTYTRNRIYIEQKEQEHLRDYKIVFGGLGLGSVIAECALRLGFENLHLIDGDLVEESNLNRQNYKLSDVGRPKAIAIYERLSAINPKANITYSNVFLNTENMAEHLMGADIAVNAIDFETSAPLVFDDVCFELGIPSVHPYNLGYGGLVGVFTKQSMSLRSFSDISEGMEILVAEHLLRVLERNGVDTNRVRFKNVLYEYMAEEGVESPPQLSVGAWLLGGLCTDIFLKIVRQESLSIFPDFYYLDSGIYLFKS